MSKLVLLMWMLLAADSALAASNGNMTLIPAGSYTPFFLKKENAVSLEKEFINVEAFLLDKTPVTNGQYLDFVSKNPEWQRSNVKQIFADSHYLQHWSGDLSVGDVNDLDRPITNVSWFAASAYCEALDGRLSSTDEWEYALTDNGRDQEKTQEKIMNWYSVPNTVLATIGSQLPNGYGVYDLVGLVWEWTSDFNGFMAPADSRDSGQKGLFCGAGALSASNLGDYAAFMRYSYRESLQGNFTGKSLGFRCVKDIK